MVVRSIVDLVELMELVELDIRLRFGEELMREDSIGGNDISSKPRLL
jgi:hypothetical protein